MTDLLEAAERGDLESVKKILQNPGVDIDELNDVSFSFVCVSDRVH